MKKILFSPHTNFLPMIKKHFSDKEKYLIYAAQDGLANALKNIDVENVELFVGTDQSQFDAYQHAVDIIKQDKKVPPKYKNDDIFAKFLQKIDAFTYRKLYDLIIFLLLLDENKPDLVVLHNDAEPFMRLIALWAKAHSVPCLHVPHSIIIDSSERSKVGTDIHDIVTASHIVVGGNYQKKWYMDRGMDENNIFQTGLPQFDKISTTIYDKDRAVRLLHYSNGEPIVTYASSWRQDTNLLGCHDGIEATYVNFLKASKKLGIKPIIKVHPNSGQSVFDWHTMVAKKVNIYAAIATQHLSTVLQASDLLFSFGPSNILLEGSFFPMQLMTTHGYEDDDVVTKIGEEASDDKIAESISELLGRPIQSTWEFQNKYLGKADGKAGDRVAGVIEGLLNG